jgi:NTE family protein
VSPEEYAEYLRRQRRAPSAPPRIRKIVLENDSGLGEQVLTSRLGIEAGDVLDEQKFRKGLDDVYGLDDFQRVGFSVHDLRDGAGDLHVRAEAKDWGPSYLRFGLELESRFKGLSTYNLSGQLTMRELNALGAEWRNDLRIGTDDMVRSEFYQPLDVASSWFVAPRIEGHNGPIGSYQGDDLVSVQHVRYATLGLDFGRKVGVWGQLRVGLERTIGEIDVDLASVPLQSPDFDDAVAHAGLEVDTLDDARFPARGSLGKIEWRNGVSGLGADSDYQLVKLSALHAFSFGRTVLTPRLELESTLSGTVPVYSQPTLGGFFKLSGLARDQLRGAQVGFAALVARHRLSRDSLMLGLPLYVGASIETGNAWDRRSQFGHDLRAAGSAYVACDTPMGPCYLAFGLADGGDEALYFFLGPLF